MKRKARRKASYSSNQKQKLVLPGYISKRNGFFSLEMYIELFLAYPSFTLKVKAQKGQKNGSYVKINVCT